MMLVVVAFFGLHFYAPSKKKILLNRLRIREQLLE